MIATVGPGLMLMIAGGLFFLISGGFPQTTWLVLGGVCLAGGGFILALGLGFWLCALTNSPSGWSMLHKEEEEETFTGAAPTEDNCMS